MTDLKALYEEDTAAWAENQAAALRAAAQGRSNQELDWENLARRSRIWQNPKDGHCAAISETSSCI